MTMRGISKPGSSTVTSALRGIVKRDATRAEMMSLALGGSVDDVQRGCLRWALAGGARLPRLPKGITLPTDRMLVMESST